MAIKTTKALLRMLILLLPLTAAAQNIKIGGSIYGGGNLGDVSGNTTVTVHAGDLDKVFGGARMANVGGRAFVNIDGEHASDFILINYLYGGNDISGTIGSSTKPTELDAAEMTEYGIDDTWNAFVRLSTKTKTEGTGDNQIIKETSDAKKIYIGQLFGGGNGAYDYTTEPKDAVKTTDPDTGEETIVTPAVENPYYNLPKPNLGKTYLQVHGGSIVYAYGGGNNATVTEKTVICLNNPSEVVNSITGTNGELLTDERFTDDMGINTGYSFPSSDAYQIGNFYGGNNTAEMAIRPEWHLTQGKVRNLYSGGNRGKMTSPEGLLLDINPPAKYDQKLVIENVYGGCRMADVIPTVNGIYTPTTNLEGYNFPDKFAARLIIRGGDITNVYGGNDITGKIYGGNAVGIRTNIKGNIYGGGNGSYPYTDNSKLKDNLIYGDFYYEVPTGKTSVEALNAFRPNAEQVSLRVVGTAAKPTIIKGSIFLGGNSATLIPDPQEVSPIVELKIGSYVIADKVFLGNNGEDMVKTNYEDNANHIQEGVLRVMGKTLGDLGYTGTDASSKFNTIELTDATTFAKYMEGAAMEIMPRVSFDSWANKDAADYVEYSSYFGSFYCGGNVGSMTKAGCETITFDHKVTIFDKLVGGCNNAIVEEQPYYEKTGNDITYVTGKKFNARYEGGVINNPDATTGNRLVLNLSGLKIQPRRWKTFDSSADFPDNYLEWNTFDTKTNAATSPVYTLDKDTGKDYRTSDEDDLTRRFEGGNIYGGCYTSGIVEGNVVINLDSTIVEREKLFDEVNEDHNGEAIYYANETYQITKRNSGVILGQQGMDVLGKALNVFGGGKGKDTEIWGSTTINLNRGYTFQIFGGSQEGVIGKPDDGTDEATCTHNGKTFKYNPKYSCTVNLRGTKAGVSKKADNSNDMAEAEFIYGGGFLGPVAGNTVINLGKGRIFNSFAGSCNADILGHTETYIGRQVKTDGTFEGGFPWIRDIVYGGNDLGGKIKGSKDFSDRVTEFAQGKVYPKTKNSSATTEEGKVKVTTASAYVEYLQGHADAIFGGCYGTYDYTDPYFKDYFYTASTDNVGTITYSPGANAVNLGTAKAGFSKPFLDNAFVNFRPSYTNENNVVKKVYGAGQGIKNEPARDSLQNRSYVLIDIPQDTATYEKYYKNMEVFGAGAYCGLGMNSSRTETEYNTTTNKVPDYDLTKVSAIIDLTRGKINSVFGGSYEEGVTRRTLVNVPRGSTIKIDSIFGGAYGEDPNIPCDVYEAKVNYHSELAAVKKIFGGNNHADRTLYGQINIDVPVYSGDVGSDGTRYQATVFGAGSGKDTWSQYTEINLLNGAQVYEVYGGGNNGWVMNSQSMRKWRYEEGTPLDLSLPGYENKDDTYIDKDDKDFHLDYGLESPLVHAATLDGKKYNTNVHIHRGATVGNYAYGGGLGADATVSGTTYIDLLGGTVGKDIYAAGTSGAVYDMKAAKDFTASATAYIEGGKCRNVYGGGWKGDVGYTPMAYTATGWTGTYNAANEIPGETHVVIGIRKEKASEIEGYGLYKGVPSIERNAYAGGEGGAVFGTANLELNNGYIGYRFFTNEPTEDFPYYTDGGGYYQEKINDETYYVNGTYQGDGRLKDCGNVFGGGYDVRSCVDQSNVTIYGGVVRNSVNGGGEIATIGRGAATEENAVREVTAIYHPGKTLVEMYNGHVRRNIFGGGKGYNIWGYGQQGTLYTDGYVFGQTEVHVHGGEVGTHDGVADGYGNVFGGGDIGYVYSRGYFNARTVAEKTANPTGSTGSPNHWYYYYDNGDGKGDQLSEDCKVVIAPELQAKTAFGSYQKYDYVPTDYLNTLKGKDKVTKQWDAAWNNLMTEDADGTERGILIHNGVFGGGNVSQNSDTQYANATTVHGNTTATIYDVYNRDFITIGTEHTGGLYGGGNWTLVDGYRELNITNYGTDYYGLDAQITLDEYRTLSSRERAYFQLQYVCKADITFDEPYKAGDILKEEDYLKLVQKYGNAVKNAFTPYGFCSIYAGRLLNTIQRADFCGVFGSRMVLQGAQDRVADVSEDIEYTINRVGEVSLNVQRFDDNSDDDLHGNYFGIYSLVNYMGNLTSDVKFGDVYRNGADEPVEGKTYYSYKKECYENNKLSVRNIGSSHNQVALASGVFLELTTEKSTEDHKDYGYITGVVELDLINVKKDIVGGGFVYAKNQHLVPMHYPNKENVLLSPYNMKTGDEARTYKQYYYTNENLPTGAEAVGASIISGDSEAFALRTWETSGNFIHPSKHIVDDCYPTNNAYDKDKSPYSDAHYWYIKGSVYIYDQEVSAYTGAAAAYSKEVNLPLTITAASHGRLQLLNVKPNLYAYKMPDPDNENRSIKIGSKEKNGKPIDKVWVNNDNDGYGLNEVVTWWDWHQMSYTDRQYFVTNTYVNCEPCTIDGVDYETGTYVLDDTDFTTFRSESHTMTKSDGTTVPMANVDDLFRSSNNVGHDTGYVLTFDMNSPDIWNDYYTKIESSNPQNDKIRESEYERMIEAAASDDAKQAIRNTWREGPTFTPLTSGVYGQRQIAAGNIVTAEEVARNKTGQGKQAVVEKAYVAKNAVTYDYTYTETYMDGEEEKTRDVTITKTTNGGTSIPATEYNFLVTTNSPAKDSFAEAYVCTQTIKLAEEKYLFYGDLKYADEITTLKSTYSSLATDIEKAMKEAYICSSAGGFGGQQFDVGTNYNALTTWCSLPENERTTTVGTDTYDSFTYNYDALDLLADPDYLEVDVTEPKIENPTNARTEAAFHTPYSKTVGVEYQAVYKAPTTGATYSYPAGTLLDGVTTYPARTLNDGDAIDQDVFEAAVRNEKSHYTRLSIAAGGETIYLATESFVYNGVPYGKGQSVDESIYTNNTSKVEPVTIANSSSAAVVKYYCYEAYDNVEKGTLISDTEFSNLKNDQKYFTIQGKEPTETTTLYVSSESDIKDVTSKRVYTVVYQYTYYEDQDDGSVKLNSELHVINIHIDLKSGAPSIGELNPPGTVLPSWGVGLTAPEVKPGIIPIITNGWDLFLTEDDAINHRNGADFVNNSTPVYWYQNQKNYIAFYSQTVRGKTYSNYVPLSVANYHDLDAVMKAKEHHLYVDRSDVDRASKIYIDNRDCESDPTKSELDLLKDFYDLSLLTKADVNTDANGLITTVKGSDPETDSDFKGHHLIDSHVRAGNNLEFILRSDVSPKATYTVGATPATWSSIGSSTCFSGNLHGDGHTISGLDHSLFDKLCGNVYNLGVTGSFTGAGIAETGDGYMENCWITSTASSFDTGTYAVFGNPTRDNSDERGPIQVVNSYYPVSNNYAVPDATTHGQATQMPDKSFYNGTVAYNLNGFYLKKRYYDNNSAWKSGISPIEYKYLPSDANGTLSTEMVAAEYPDTYAVYQPKRTDEKDSERPWLGYVEQRFYDGDFIYAAGTIPENNNVRMRTVTTTTTDPDSGNTTTTSKNYFTPIWPDDYLFFGQTLSYGHVDDRPHQETPSVINRSGERVDKGDSGNRVYRAPAYFRSGKMEVAHFNPGAVFAQTKKGEPSVIAYKDMTAIDFTGGNGDVAAGYQSENITAAPYNNITGGAFYPPLLDDDGLTSIQNVDLTRNLLVYAKAGTKTDNVVDSYLQDEAYEETNDKYHTVAVWDSYADAIRGHWVQQTSAGAYTAQRDHMLVDKEDFNAPIGYQFTDDYRMWYQRMPEHYAGQKTVTEGGKDKIVFDSSAGWEGISLPFKAEIVTTDVKGELTHFYNNSGKNNTGHEYWLREFKGNVKSKKDADNNDIPNVYTADFKYPNANSDDGLKKYSNTFLWDYYYSYNNIILNDDNTTGEDMNGDEYQENDATRFYYKQGREYTDYPRLAAAKPYIVGFPGQRYYEFDLSGVFEAKTARATNPKKLGPQTITFASATGASIGVSDDEMAGETAGSSYAFKPNYLNSPDVATGKHAFLLNSDGNSYVEDKTATTAAVSAFRPYFESTPSLARGTTRSIVFSDNTNDDLHGILDNGSADDTGRLTFSTRRHTIIATSTLRQEAPVTIHSTDGVVIAAFNIQPGETIETRVNRAGVYIVNNKKVTVK